MLLEQLVMELKGTSGHITLDVRTSPLSDNTATKSNTSKCIQWFLLSTQYASHTSFQQQKQKQQKC